MRGAPPRWAKIVSDTIFSDAGGGPESRRWFARAERVTPGGVDSPVRAFGAVGGTPLVIREARGATIVDVDGRKYVDFVGSWGPLILGHAHPKVVEAVAAACARGTSYGAPCVPEIELAEEVVAAYPGLEQVRFVSSGTEAVMSAIRLARGATGRELIVKFSGCYHGHADHLLVAAGSGLVTFGQPSSAGVPKAFAELTRVLPLDDEAALDALFSAEGDRIAAVIIEGVPANNGMLLQRREFLEALRAHCNRHGALLIFDEVITGFGRLGAPFAADVFGVTPDIMTTAKGVTNGAVPMGAVFVKKEIYDSFMTGPEHLIEFAHGYTYSAHPLACAAGVATMETYKEEGLLTRGSGEIGQYWADALHSLKDAPHVIDIRNIGLVGAIELQPIDGQPTKRAFSAFLKAFEKNLMIRTTGDIIAMSPPLIVEKQHIDQIVTILREVLSSIE